MNLRFALNPFIYWETPGGASAGAGTAVQPGSAPAEGAEAPGQGGQGQGSEGFWNLFPNVPEEHRPLLEPHLRNMQGEITRLQQSQSGLQPVIESGATPEQIQGLILFDQRYRQDPLGVFGDMAAQLQQQGHISSDLDLESLMAIARGEDTGDEEPGAPVEGMEGIPPQVLQYIQSLEEKVNGIETNLQQENQRRTEAQQDRLFQQQKSKMKEALVKAGYSDELITDETLASYILTHRGNVAAATKALIDLRTGTLKGFTQQQQQPKNLEVPENGLGTPQRTVRNPQDPFEKARAGATSRLVRANRSRAQG